ncbi:DNA/RNA non-specific endonuclease [Actinomadura sp. HBU206391]|uniref:DNA/RNA non-specific endonuclease n=1 Tax=Actinomadura sp. HBU206391 TaxID=2731692 RepID=UPI00164F7E3D|nr:DNA/RNA non-specific endonuclease [Actinomadura sp. HBU206391]MBC6460597.1 DNA/RNA non-specific endonuclease [Actinomadura sp. HBU206391]
MRLSAPSIRDPSPGWPRTDNRPEWKVPSSWPTANIELTRDSWLFHRGHLLGNQLGGKRLQNNLITQFQRSNNSLQKPVENRVANAVGVQGEQIYYYAIPVYSDLPSPADPHPDKVGPSGWPGALPSIEYAMPNKVYLVAQGTNGFFLDACIPNTQHPEAVVTYDDPCVA